MKALTFVRKQVKLKGKSVHEGRGYYDCYIDNMEPKDVLNEVRKCVKNWQDLGYVSKFEDKGNNINVELKKEYFEGVYRGFSFNDRLEGFACYMLWDNDNFDDTLEEYSKLQDKKNEDARKEPFSGWKKICNKVYGWELVELMENVISSKWTVGNVTFVSHLGWKGSVNMKKWWTVNGVDFKKRKDAITYADSLMN